MREIFSNHARNRELENEKKTIQRNGEGMKERKRENHRIKWGGRENEILTKRELENE